MQNTMKVLPGHLAHLDPLLIIIAMLIYRNAFASPVLDYFENPAKIPYLPFKLEIKEEFLNKPLFVAEDMENALTYDSFQKFLKKAGAYLGWHSNDLFI